MEFTHGLSPDALTALIAGILRADGCDAAEAAAVAEHLVEANLSGHDSHGIVRITRYHDWLLKGQIHAGRSLKVLLDTGAALQLDGQDGMGQWLARRATDMAMERAEAHGIAILALRRAGHIGRAGSFAEQAVAQGFVSVNFVNVAGSRLVAPFGAFRRCISTAPVAIGVPNPGGGDFILDFATSVAAEGKALVASQGGKPLPAGALIDGEGRLTEDPAVLYGETLKTAVPDPKAGPGALRAMGEHKGSGLALACELLAGALTGNGTCVNPERGFGNGLFSVIVKRERFDDLGAFAAEVAAYVDYVRASPPAAGHEAVLIPGDRERALRAERRRTGLSLPTPVLEQILAIATDLALPAEVPATERGLRMPA
ncbi:MAG: Ldh family oxidoreductase [Pseudomonadota bacterium]